MMLTLSEIMDTQGIEDVENLSALDKAVSHSSELEILLNSANPLLRHGEELVDHGDTDGIMYLLQSFRSILKDCRYRNLMIAEKLEAMQAEKATV